MLAHLSPKFNTSQGGQHEPRACLILNRFTRALTILYATNILKDILDFPPDEAVGMTFFEFISHECLQDAVEALERAKENDSIAYLRFFARDPRLAEAEQDAQAETLRRRRRLSNSPRHRRGIPTDGPARDPNPNVDAESDDDANDNDSIMTSDAEDDDDDGEDGEEEADENNYYSNSHSTSRTSLSNSMPPASRGPEVEAVVSCTSDGLVVVLRRARPMIPFSDPRMGFFASPWARPPYPPPGQVVANGPGGPEPADFMDSIRQVAVFAWCLRSINENMVQFAKFEPDGAEPVLTPPRDHEHLDGADADGVESDRSAQDYDPDEKAGSSRNKTAKPDYDQSMLHDPNECQHHPSGCATPTPHQQQQQQRAMNKRKRSD